MIEFAPMLVEWLSAVFEHWKLIVGSGVVAFLMDMATVIFCVGSVWSIGVSIRTIG